MKLKRKQNRPKNQPRFRTTKIGIPSNMSLARAFRKYFAKYRKTFLPVTQDGRVMGILDLGMVGHIPPDERTKKHVGMEMLPVDRIPRICRDRRGNLMDELNFDPATDSPYALVTNSRDEIVGILCQKDGPQVLEYPGDFYLSAKAQTTASTAPIS